MKQLQRGDFVIHKANRKTMRVVAVADGKVLCAFNEVGKRKLQYQTYFISEVEFKHSNERVIILTQKNH